MVSELWLGQADRFFEPNKKSYLKEVPGDIMIYQKLWPYVLLQSYCSDKRTSYFEANSALFPLEGLKIEIYKKIKQISYRSWFHRGSYKALIWAALVVITVEGSTSKAIVLSLFNFWKKLPYKKVKRHFSTDCYNWRKSFSFIFLCTKVCHMFNNL